MTKFIESKAQGGRHLATLIISWVTVFGLGFPFVKPALVEAVSTAMAEEIEDTVKDTVAPINNAFEVLLTLQINTARKDIATMQFRQRQGVDWNSEDASDLTEKQIELEAYARPQVD